MKKECKKLKRAKAAQALGEKIGKIFSKFKVNIQITGCDFYGEQIHYKVKLKENTTKDDVKAHAEEVQFRLKLPHFQVYEADFTLYIIVAMQVVQYPRLLEVLNTPAYIRQISEMELPYVVGHGIMMQPVIVDLAQFPHLLLGGSTGSGKSTGLQAMIMSIILNKDPSIVNLILIDVGASSLKEFKGIPHLSCPIIRDWGTAYSAIIALETEMKRRISLEYDDPTALEQLPYLMLVVDEFPALVMGVNNKDMSKRMANAISILLQRGRHAKIHLVLTAQNPTFQNMKVDLGNITSRIAFKCAKKNFSETIIGESGAENLVGQGCLYLKSPQTNGIQWVQGIYIKPEEIQDSVQKFSSPQYKYDAGKKFLINILTEAPGGLFSRLQPVAAPGPPFEDDKLISSVIYWTLGRDHISTNMVQTEFHMGWKRASDIIKHLEELGIVDGPKGKQPRCVRPKSIKDLSDDLVRLMELCDYPHESLVDAFPNIRKATDVKDTSEFIEVSHKLVRKIIRHPQNSDGGGKT